MSISAFPAGRTPSRLFRRLRVGASHYAERTSKEQLGEGCPAVSISLGEDALQAIADRAQRDTAALRKVGQRHSVADCGGKIGLDWPSDGRVAGGRPSLAGGRDSGPEKSRPRAPDRIPLAPMWGLK